MAAPGRPSLPPDQAARVLAKLVQLRDERFGGNVSALAKALSRSQPAIWAILEERNVPSFETATRIAKLAGMDVFDLLGPGRSRTIELTERYPNRTEAVAIARRDGFSEAAIANVLEVRAKSNEDQLITEWLREIREEHLRLGDPLPKLPKREFPAPDADEAVGALERRRRRKAGA